MFRRVMIKPNETRSFVRSIDRTHSEHEIIISYTFRKEFHWISIKIRCQTFRLLPARSNKTTKNAIKIRRIPRSTSYNCIDSSCFKNGLCRPIEINFAIIRDKRTSTRVDRRCFYLATFSPGLVTNCNSARNTGNLAIY